MTDRLHEKLNLTPFSADLGFCLDREGRDVAVALLKATFRFTPQGKVEPAPAEEMLRVVLADEHHGEPADSSLRYAGEVVPLRRGTDVAVVGHAYGRGRSEIAAGFRLGSLEKLVAVSGTRTWAGTPSSPVVGPKPFEKVPLRYEHAFGGSYDDGDRGRVAYAENPVGVGFARALRPGAPLPNLEDRARRLRSSGDRPPPASLGFIPPGWRQRARFAGTFDAAWKRDRRPLFPADLDDRFWNAVPQDQVLPQKLRGGEKLVLLHLHPTVDSVVVTLPSLRFTATFNVDGRSEQLPMEADTLLVEPDLERLAITWRASLPAEGALRLLRTVVFRAVGEAARSPA
jgi:hypothetical protein